MDLASVIRQIVPLSDEELAQVFSQFDEIELKKDKNFLRRGEQCDKIGFITSGSMIYLREDSKGKEIAIDFAFEGDWVTYYYSLLLGNPSDIIIRTNEPTSLLVIKKKNLYSLYNSIPKIERVGRILAEKNFIELAQRTITFQSLPAAARYESLFKTKPQALQRMPQYHIASYLGVKPQSLSRLRKKI